jgi:hypothetical protein
MSQQKVFSPDPSPSVLFAPRSKIIDEYVPQSHPPARRRALSVPSTEPSGVSSSFIYSRANLLSQTIDHLIALLSGEKILSQMQAISSSFTAGCWGLGDQGVLIMTNFRLVFIPLRELFSKDCPAECEIGCENDHRCSFLLNLRSITESVGGIIRPSFICRDCPKTITKPSSGKTQFYDLGILSIPFGTIHNVLSLDPLSLQTTWPSHLPSKCKAITAGIFQIDCKSFRSLLFLSLSHQSDFITEFQTLDESSHSSFLFGSCGTSQTPHEPRPTSVGDYPTPTPLTISDNLWGNLTQWWYWPSTGEAQSPEVYSAQDECETLRYHSPTPEDQELFHSFASTLQEKCFFNSSVQSLLDSFAFTFRLPFPVEGNGWGLYDIEKEFLRMRFSDTYWKICDMNDDFVLSPTYPQYFITPQSVTRELLKGTAKFRTKKRFPAVVWRSKKHGTVLVRCSQPMTGLLRSKNAEDVELFNAISISSAKDRWKKYNFIPITIFDCRPKLNAYANQAQGAGVEAIEYYPGCRLEYLGIHNIHTMRDSLRQVHELCRQYAEPEKGMNWFSSLEYTGWFSHLHFVIKGAVDIVNCIDHPTTPSNAVVHCSDGWDRTSQIVSLAELLLDPYYRSLEGFQILIEKEWISFGHKFSDRTGVGKRSIWEENESGPIFLQWVECVWQICNQFPCAFEFNCFFLIFVLDALHSALFGNFFFNSNKEREEHHVAEKTCSIWGFVNHSHNRLKFINPFYSPQDEVLRPCVGLIKMRFWGEYYHRYFSFHSQSMTNEAKWEAKFSEATSHHSTLRDQVRELTETKRALEEKTLSLQQELSVFKVSSHNGERPFQPDLSQVLIFEDYGTKH